MGVCVSGGQSRPSTHPRVPAPRTPQQYECAHQPRETPYGENGGQGWATLDGTPLPHLIVCSRDRFVEATSLWPKLAASVAA